MKYLYSFFFCFLSMALTAQSDSLKSFPAQISFVYPIGSHLNKSTDYVYNFSLNVLVGKTGGLSGVEVGGLANVNSGNVSGAQFAGICNLNAVGANNIVQFGGICNLVKEDVKGFQAAGIVNSVGGFSTAVQVGGIANLSKGLKGVQIAGIGNQSRDSTEGAQIAGIFNIANKSNKLFQLAGISNYADSAINAQIAGICNIAKTVNGIQLAGILNICDSINGVPIALVSIVRKNGYRRFELWTSELTIANLSFKTGVRKFYTIFDLGYSSKSDYNIYFGFGVGTSISLNERNYLDIEYHISQPTQNWSIMELNHWNQVRVNFSHNFGKRFAIFGGPSFNLLVSESVNSVKALAPSWARTYKENNYLSLWMGFNAGLRF